MFEIIQSGGWMMVPIILCSVLALGISVERFWTLRAVQIAPPDLLAKVWSWMKNKQLNAERIRELQDSCPLGRGLAAGECTGWRYFRSTGHDGSGSGDCHSGLGLPSHAAAPGR